LFPVRIAGLLVVLFAFLFPVALGAAEDDENARDADPGGREVVVLRVKGAIGPGIGGYIADGIVEARERGAELVILHMDTPGGLDSATRDIIQAIIASQVPVATFVAPSGARAASAGTYILYASHIAVMAPGTTLGAATPVQVGGDERPTSPLPPLGRDRDRDRDEADDDEADEEEEAAREEPAGTAMERKMVEDSAAYMRALAQMRGRNAEWAEKAVREAASLSSEEALAENVIEFIARDIDDLLRQVEGHTVSVLGVDREVSVDGLPVVEVEPSWRARFLSVITDPNILPILMTLGMLGLIYEMLNPGALVPGVMGGIFLLLALFAAQVLPVNFAGVALILLGTAFMIGEAFMPSFGILGIGGVVAFVIGSVILVDTELEGFGVSLPFIISIAILNALVIFGIMMMVVKSRKRAVVSGQEEMVGSIAVARTSFEGEGTVRVHSEDWTARCDTPVEAGQKVRVTALDGLVLIVEPYEPEKGGTSK